MRLKGKSAIITGAARGIGAAFAAAYVREGATVAIADIDMVRAEQTAKSIGPSAFAIRLDVTDQSSIDNAIAEVEKRCGGIDILINNAGDKFDHFFQQRPIRTRIIDHQAITYGYRARYGFGYRRDRLLPAGQASKHKI